MRGIILAAGRGSRLNQMTRDRPKCLIEFAGKTLLSWQLTAMKTAGIKKILVVRGYCGEMIEGDFEVCDNTQWQDTNMVASLLCAKDWLIHEPCIVSYSDIIYNSDALLPLMKSDGILSMLYDLRWQELWEKRFPDPLSDAESFCIDEHGYLLEIGRKNVTLKEIQGQYMGLLKFTPDSVRWIDKLLNEQPLLDKKIDVTALLSLLIKMGYKIKAIPWNGGWCEIDNENDLAVAKRLLETKNLNII